MAKTPQNNGKAWSNEDLTKFNKLIKQNTPTPLIAYKLQRTQPSIRAKAHDIGKSLKPTNKSPYGKAK